MGCDACADGVCEARAQLDLDGQLREVPSGLEHCASGRWHRASAETCLAGTATGCVGSTCECQGEQSCLLEPDGACACARGCATDADCADDQLCACSANGFGGAPRCVPALCRTDADCGGRRCMQSTQAPLGNPFLCESDADECQVDGDCLWRGLDQNCLVLDDEPPDGGTSTRRACVGQEGGG